MSEPRTLADVVNALREQVLAPQGGREPAGEVFDAAVRLIHAHGQTTPDLELALRESITRRLAWGESEAIVLRDADETSQRLIAAARRELGEGDEAMEVAVATCEAACSTARVVVQAALGRVARERAALLREELARERLAQALERVQAEIARLESGDEGGARATSEAPTQPRTRR